MTKNDKAVLLIPINTKSRNDFKKLCIDKNTSMAAVVRSCVQVWIDKHNKKVVY